MSFLKANSALSAPSPTPSNSSTSGAKRKRPADDAPANTVYSQPGDTGTGHHIYTQVGYAIEYLRSQDRWCSLQEIYDYLNISAHDTHTRSQLKSVFSGNNPRIEWNSKGNYRYKPKHSVRNAEQLKGFLQNQKSAQGVLVKELKDGWPTAQGAIAVMERKKELLVVHNKKDGSAKVVWINDPTLMHSVDADFLNEWHKTPLPSNPEDLRSKLVAAGLKPSSAPKEIQTMKPKEKKKKAARRGGKQTNTHMAAILKDYSHKRK